VSERVLIGKHGTEKKRGEHLIHKVGRAIIHHVQKKRGRKGSRGGGGERVYVSGVGEGCDHRENKNKTSFPRRRIGGEEMG